MSKSKNDKTIEKVTIKNPLKPEEVEELRDAQAVYEMTKTAGWQFVLKMLNTMAFHSWVDPREAKDKKEWEWRELNAFHAANNAQELLSEIQKVIEKSEYLDKVKSGELQRRPMRI